MINLVYVPLVGIPLSLMLMTAGCLLCLTIIGIPAGLVCFAAGAKVLTIHPRPQTIVIARR
jgi:uncharacterized membrane protein YccF (DUF307 family)